MYLRDLAMYKWRGVQVVDTRRSRRLVLLTETTAEIKNFPETKPKTI